MEKGGTSVTIQAWKVSLHSKYLWNQPQARAAGRTSDLQLLQVKGNAEEFVMYGLLHAAVVNPRQLAIDMRDVPARWWQHPFLQHAIQVDFSHHLASRDAGGA